MPTNPTISIYISKSLGYNNTIAETLPAFHNAEFHNNYGHNDRLPSTFVCRFSDSHLLLAKPIDWSRSRSSLSGVHYFCLNKKVAFACSVGSFMRLSASARSIFVAEDHRLFQGEPCWNSRCFLFVCQMFIQSNPRRVHTKCDSHLLLPNVWLCIYATAKKTACALC